MTAPLQLIGLTFRLGADAESRLLAEVDRIEGRGVVRVLDIVLVAKGRDGTVEGMEVGDDEDFGSLHHDRGGRSARSVAMVRSFLLSSSRSGVSLPPQPSGTPSCWCHAMSDCDDTGDRAVMQDDRGHVCGHVGGREQAVMSTAAPDANDQATGAGSAVTRRGPGMP